jgi:hypothetical protein
MLFSFIYLSHLTQIFYLAYQFVNLAMLESLVVNDNKFLKTAFVAEKNRLCMVSSTLRILSYNIWLEDLEMGSGRRLWVNLFNCILLMSFVSRCAIWFHLIGRLFIISMPKNILCAGGYALCILHF